MSATLTTNERLFQLSYTNQTLLQQQDRDNTPIAINIHKHDKALLLDIESIADIEDLSDEETSETIIASPLLVNEPHTQSLDTLHYCNCTLSFCTLECTDKIHIFFFMFIRSKSMYII